MSKRFATQPTAKPITPKKSRSKSKEVKQNQNAAPAAKNFENSVDDSDSNAVSSTQLAGPSGDTDNTAEAEAPGTSRSEKTMNISLTKSTAARKDDRLVIFNFKDGRAGSVQFLRSAFPEVIPDEISMSGEFAEPKVRVPKEKETPEQRKTRLAALPKLTLAEKLQRAEERTAKLREKVAKAGSAPAGDSATV